MAKLRVSGTSDDNLRGALLMLGSSIFFVLAGLAVKVAAADMSNAMIVFFRNAVAAVILLPWVWHDLAGRVSGGRYGMHIVRTLASLAAMYCYFGAIARIPLADAVLLQFTSPIFVPLLALLMLRVALEGRAVSAAIVGFIGVAIVLDPQGAVLSTGALLALGSGLLSAVAVIAIWVLSGSESAARIVFFYSLFSSIFSAVPLIWAWETPDIMILPALIAVGITSAFAQLLFTAAVSAGNPNHVVIVSYTGVIWAGLAGYAFWNETIGWGLIVGTGIIIVACVAATRFQPKTAIASADTAMSRGLSATDDLRKLSTRDLDDIGARTHDIATAVDREISRLQIDEFRSRG
jgi:drug/metabolite transporter (DMT)-like permease